jgi:hypothetical protein
MAGIGTRIVPSAQPLGLNARKESQIRGILARQVTSRGCSSFPGHWQRFDNTPSGKLGTVQGRIGTVETLRAATTVRLGMTTCCNQTSSDAGVAMLVWGGLLARLQALEAARHDLREAAGAGLAPVEAAGRASCTPTPRLPGGGPASASSRPRCATRRPARGMRETPLSRGDTGSYPLGTTNEDRRRMKSPVGSSHGRQFPGPAGGDSEPQVAATKAADL